jgi:hypothetical protein
MYTNAMFWRQILNKRFHLCTLPVSTMLMGRYHIESNLLFKSCMKFRKSKNQSETSEVESYPVYENLGEIIDVTLCPKENGSDVDGQDMFLIVF